MPGRKFSAATQYRYGFNGKENDNEVKGEGNEQDYGMRIYDPRLGRFLSVDPLIKKYPELTPYQFASNRPVDGIDIDGLEYFKKDNTNYHLDYKPVLTAPNIWTGLNNGAGNILNFIANNTIVPFQQLSQGVNNYLAGGYKEQTSDPMSTFMNWQKNNYDYHANTPIKQQFKDFGNAALDLRSYELGAQLIIAHQLPILNSEGLSLGGDFKFGLKFKAELPPGTKINGFSFGNTPKMPLGAPLPSKLMTYGCEVLASKVQKIIGGEFLQITPTEGNFLGPVKYSGGSINNWAYHVAVIKDGIVYDGMTGSAGMALDKYKTLFEYSDALKFEQVKTITVK